MAAGWRKVTGGKRRRQMRSESYLRQRGLEAQWAKNIEGGKDGCDVSQRCLPVTRWRGKALRFLASAG